MIKVTWWMPHSFALRSNCANAQLLLILLVQAAIRVTIGGGQAEGSVVEVFLLELRKVIVTFFYFDPFLHATLLFLIIFSRHDNFFALFSELVRILAHQIININFLQIFFNTC